MPIIEWKMEYQVGIQEIDRHHKSMVKSLNKSYDQFREGREVEATYLQELLDYAAHHFTCEEGWMKKTRYPHLAEHQAEHALFTGKILNFKKEYKRRSRVSVELLWFLCNWVTHHIGGTDAEFGRFVDLQHLGGRNHPNRAATAV